MQTRDLIVKYEVRFTATTYRYGTALPRTQTWKRRFSVLEKAESYAGEVKRAMELPLYTDESSDDHETQAEWLDIDGGEDGAIDSFDGIWEILETHRRLDDDQNPIS